MSSGRKRSLGLAGSLSKRNNRTKKAMVESKTRDKSVNANPYLPTAQEFAPKPFSTEGDEQISDDAFGYTEKHRYNPLTEQQYSSRYWKIFKQRQELPVYAKRDQFLKLLNDNQTVVLVGETGSGKTTQIPQFCVQAGYASNGMQVACTQPRRVAALSVAKRVSEEMDVELGDHVGYSIRFDDRTSQLTNLRYMTDGMLLRHAMTDPKLSRYSVIILDEAHERTISTDVLMGLLKEILARRPDLKLVVMSATLDAEKFQKYFDGAPLIKCPGRTFPVEIFYVQEPIDNYAESAVETAVQVHMAEKKGDILVFLTGEREIEECRAQIQDRCDAVQDRFGPVVVLPLYSSLPPGHQQRIFDPAPPALTPGGPSGRKIIVSTNIAETSLTIDGVMYVIDPGFSKQKLFNPRTRVESLSVAAISRASAKQRAGRAGRTAPGKCYRLYTKQALEEKMLAQTYPEILRSNLCHVYLHLIKLGVKDLVRFDFMDPPAPESMSTALNLLYQLRAIALNREARTLELTDVGKLLVMFPLDPPLAMLLAKAHEYQCSEEMLTICAMLSVPRVRIVPSEQKERQRAQYMHEEFVHVDGDHLTLLQIYEAYKHNGENRRWCQQHYLNHRNLKNADNVRYQLSEIMRTLGLHARSQPHSRDYYINIRRCLVEGFFHQVAHRDSSGNYITPMERQVVSLHPSCGLEDKPEFVLFHEFVSTSQQFIRNCTAIRGEWLLDHPSGFYNFDGNFPDSACKRALLRLSKRKGRSKSGRSKQK